MLRYLHRLQGRDLSLTHSMIPLGIVHDEAQRHLGDAAGDLAGVRGAAPVRPAEQALGYDRAVPAARIAGWRDHRLLEAVSLQPNAGAQGEYAGLLTIRAYHDDRGENQRDVCLIPTSAHGTNPASAVMAGLRVVPVACDARQHRPRRPRGQGERARRTLAALMITYPSTHGVFERGVARSARSSTSTAGRSISTART